MGIVIGTDIFIDFMKKNGYFVDKSLFIKEVIDCTGQVMLITRPRRFGKTLNMTMLEAFLSCDSNEDYTDYFEPLKIWAHSDCKEYFQNLPAVFFSLKDVTALTWDSCANLLTAKISDILVKYSYLKDRLNERDRSLFDKFERNIASLDECKLVLGYLTKWLYDYYGKKVYLLIDEYDNPIQEGYHNGYYDEIISFMQVFLGSALKTNPYLEKAVMTGVTQISGESLLSKFNNFVSYSVLNQDFGDKFGFTEDEVINALKDNAPFRNIDEVRDMYNGYLFGGQCIYNPWSIMNMLSKNENVPLSFYWYNSSSDRILREAFAKKDNAFKETLYNLINGETIREPIKSETTYLDLQKSGDAVWSFLLYSGYLSLREPFSDENGDYALSIPNKEVRIMVRDIVMSWFTEWGGRNGAELFFKSLLLGDEEAVYNQLSYIIRDAFSYFDTTLKMPELMYHAFILGMLQFLGRDYYCESNANMG